jgi:hypothetical protein
MAQLGAVEFDKIGLVDCNDALPPPVATVSYRWNSLPEDHFDGPEQVYAYGPFENNEEYREYKLEDH